MASAITVGRPWVSAVSLASTPPIFHSRPSTFDSRPSTFCTSLFRSTPSNCFLIVARSSPLRRVCSRMCRVTNFSLSTSRSSTLTRASNSSLVTYVGTETTRPDLQSNLAQVADVSSCWAVRRYHLSASPSVWAFRPFAHWTRRRFFAPQSLIEHHWERDCGTGRLRTRRRDPAAACSLFRGSDGRPDRNFLENRVVVRRGRLRRGHRRPQPHPSVGALCGAHDVRHAHCARTLYGELDLGVARHQAAGSRRDLYFADAQFSSTGEDRRYRRGDRQSRGTDRREIACAPSLYVQGRRGDRARRRGAGEGAAASESATADHGRVRL